MQIKICSKCGFEKIISRKHGKCNLCRSLEYKEKNNSRVCRGCSKMKLRNEFNGSDRYCLQCHDLRDNNKKESRRKGAAKYRKQHPDKIREKNSKIYRRKYYGDSPKQILTYRLQACRKRAKERKLVYNLDIVFLLELYAVQKSKCAVTGIDFDFTFDKKFSKRPFSPSVDRINSKFGYTKDNVRLVCSSVNTALSEYGDEIFDKICQAYIRNKHATN
jgi:hypothetical protein